MAGAFVRQSGPDAGKRREPGTAAKDASSKGAGICVREGDMTERSPRAALATMIELNDRYALDGRDPNSYDGIFWTLGKYDRPWDARSSERCAT